MTGKVLRAIAILIAILAVVDPVVRISRPARPVVAVVAGDPRYHSELARRVGDELARSFTVIRAPFPAAEASIVAGNIVPEQVRSLGGKLFVITPHAQSPLPQLQYVSAPSRAALHSRIVVDAVMRSDSAGAARPGLDASLYMNGLLVDKITGDSARADAAGARRVSLSGVPVDAGPVHLRVVVRHSGSRDSVGHDVVVNVVDRRWSILFFDRRPSWMSTFVRRAIENDQRFHVTSRVMTSRGVSTDAGQPPDTFEDAALLSQFDAIVAGAPDALTDSDVRGIESYLRRTGGTAIFLLDRVERGPFDRLTGSQRWITSEERLPRSVAQISASSVTDASEFATPSELPPGATEIALAPRTSIDSAIATPVIWSTRIGAGRVVVSGALDAWRFRETDERSFDDFWSGIVADAAASTPSPIEIQPERSVFKPGEVVRATLTMRDAALNGFSRSSQIDATLSAHLADDGNRDTSLMTLRLWPDAVPGRFRAEFRAPARVGNYSIVASALGLRAAAPILVRDDRETARRAAPALLSSLASSRGGKTISESAIHELRAELESSLERPMVNEAAHPMRSPWWVIPFALALAAEWFLRRRRGLS